MPQAASIENFTQQFRWAQELGRALVGLAEGGHFDFQAASLEVALADPSAVAQLADTVADMKARLLVRGERRTFVVFCFLASKLISFTPSEGVA